MKEKQAIEPKKETEISKAVNILRKELSKDDYFKFTYQSNIAMAFLDVLHRGGYKFPCDHGIANQAAINFLNNFIGDIQ